jgi:hypothetical protein
MALNMIYIDKQKLRLELLYLAKAQRIWSSQEKLEALIDQVQNNILKLIIDANKRGA